MTDKITHYTHNSKLYFSKVLGIIGVFLIIFSIATLGFRTVHDSHADVPSTPTLTNVCGATNDSDIEPPTETVTAYETAIQKTIVPSSNIQMNSFHLANVGGTEEAYVLTDASQTRSIYIYNLSTGAEIGSPFTVPIYGNSNDAFAVDPSGNIYVVNMYANGYTPSLYKLSATGAIIWTKAQPSGSQINPAYGYTASNGTWYVAYVGSTSSGPVYDQTGTSIVYDQNGNQQANNNMDISGGAEQDATTGDILSTGDGMFRVYTSAGALKFQMGTTGGSSVPFTFTNLSGAVEDPAGGYYISDNGSGMDAFDANGGYLGQAPDYQSNNGAVNTIGVNPGHTAIYNGRIYYYLNGGVDSFDSSDNSPGIYSISQANLQNDVNYPQGQTGHLGIGAGLSTAGSQSHNYYSAGSTPAVNLSFYPWWSTEVGGKTIGSNFTVTYSVRSIAQVEANVDVTPTAINLGNYMTGPSTSPLSVPISLGSDTTAGAYEINAHMYNNSDPSLNVGSDCLDYSVGASGDIYSPSTFDGETPNTQLVELSHELGQNYVRGNASSMLDDCLPGVTTTTSSTQLACPASEVTDVNKAAALASSYGMTFAPELAETGSTLDTEIVSSGQWSRLVGSMASTFPSVNHWLLWNEINNDGGNYNSGTWDTTNIFEPAYTAIKAAEPNDKVIAGSSLEVSPGFWQAVGAAGGFKYMDGLDVHPYTDYNKSFEEQGMIIPPQDATASEAANLGNFDQLMKVASDTKDYAFNTGVTSMPVSDSEFGIWNDGTESYYNQANKQVRGTILQNSIGVSNVSVFLSNTSGACFSVSGANWGSVGCGYDGGDAPAALAQVTMQHMLDGSTVSGNRKFLQWLPTGVPHTYAAEYGPSATNTNDVVAIWADDYDVNVVPTLSGGGSIADTSQYGSSSSVTSGTSMTLNGQVQYLAVPAGQTLSLNPQEVYAANQALASAGATATASSTTSCGSLSAAAVVNGVDDLSVDSRCNSAAFWAQKPTDTNPTFTVTLKNPESIDRVFLSSTGIDSAVDGLRSFDVQVAPTAGGTFTTVGSVTNAYFERNHLVSFGSQTVAQIRIANMVVNYTGTGNGLPPVWWPEDTADLTDQTQPWYGQDDIMDIEAFAPGATSVGVTPPSTAITTPATATTAHSNSFSVTASATANGSSISKVELYIGSQLAATDTTAPYTFSLNPLTMKDGPYELTTIAYTTGGVSATSSPVMITVDNGDLNNDGTVNAEDLGIMSLHYSTTGQNYANGDLNSDGSINAEDLGILSNNYGWKN